MHGKRFFLGTEATIYERIEPLNWLKNTAFFNFLQNWWQLRFLKTSLTNGTCVSVLLYSGIILILFTGHLGHGFDSLFLVQRYDDLRKVALLLHLSVIKTIKLFLLPVVRLIKLDFPNLIDIHFLRTMLRFHSLVFFGLEACSHSARLLRCVIIRTRIWLVNFLGHHRLFLPQSTRWLSLRFLLFFDGGRRFQFLVNGWTHLGLLGQRLTLSGRLLLGSSLQRGFLLIH